MGQPPPEYGRPPQPDPRRSTANRGYRPSDQEYDPRDQGYDDRAYGGRRYDDRAYGDQRYDDHRYDDRGYDQAYGDRGYDDQGYDNQGYGDPGYGDRGYGNQGHGARDRGYGSRGQSPSPRAEVGPRPASGQSRPRPQAASPLPPPRAKGRRAPLITSIAIGLLLLGAAGVGIFVLKKNAADEHDAKRATSASAHDGGSTDPARSGSAGDPSPSAADEDVHGDLTGYQPGDCLTLDAGNNVKPAKCTDAKAYKVLSRHEKTANTSLCGTDTSLYNESSNKSEDLVLCIAEVE